MALTESNVKFDQYDPAAVCAFMRSREAFGNLSNMTGGMPLSVNGLRFQSSEGLYQALKFPHDPERQRRIANAASGMDAKRVAYEQGATPMPGWDAARIPAMALTLAEKLRQHPVAFGRALRETRNRPIVEKSYRDDFWGARPRPAGMSRNGGRLSAVDCLTGRNALGKLLTALRDADDADAFADGYADTAFTVNGRPFPATPTAAGIAAAASPTQQAVAAFF